MLRKLHFLVLCRRWRYRADVWVPREVAARKRTRDPSPQKHAHRPSPPVRGAAQRGAAQQALARSGWLQQLPLPLALPDASVDALRNVFSAHLQQYIALTDDTHVFAAAQREPHAQLLTWTVPMLDSLLSVMRGFAAVTTSDAAALSNRCHAFSTGAADAEALRWMPWWLSEDQELLLRTDAHFVLMHKFMQAFFAGLRNVRRPDAPPLSVTDAAIVEGWMSAISALDVMVSTGQSALAQARLSLPTPEYLRVAAEALSMLVATMQHMIRLNEARRAWCAARQAGTSCTSARTDAFWPVVATVARESVIPSACYTQPRLTYALELFAIVGAPGARREASPASSSLLAHMGLAISTAVL